MSCGGRVRLRVGNPYRPQDVVKPCPSDHVQPGRSSACVPPARRSGARRLPRRVAAASGARRRGTEAEKEGRLNIWMRSRSTVCASRNYLRILSQQTPPFPTRPMRDVSQHRCLTWLCLLVVGGATSPLRRLAGSQLGVAGRRGGSLNLSQGWASLHYSWICRDSQIGRLGVFAAPHGMGQVVHRHEQWHLTVASPESWPRTVSHGPLPRPT